MGELLIATIILFAVFTQAMAGFGVALISMPLVTKLIGIEEAAPLIALVSIVCKIVILARHRQHFNVRDVVQLVIASVIGIPFGLQIAEQMNGQIVITLLGIVIIIYALYALSNPKIPRINRSGWAYGLGFLSGILAGAYNVGGPPAIIYGTGRRWPPAEFKGNLQGFAMLNSVMVISNHALRGNFTPVVWQHFLIGIPFIGLGLLIGFKLETRINPAVFRRLVLVLLIASGLNLIF